MDEVEIDQTRDCVMDSSKNSASSAHSGQPATAAASDLDEQHNENVSATFSPSCRHFPRNDETNRRLSVSRAKSWVLKEGGTRHVVSLKKQ